MSAGRKLAHLQLHGLQYPPEKDSYSHGNFCTFCAMCEGISPADI